MLIALGVVIIAVLVAAVVGVGPLALRERPGRNGGLLDGTLPTTALALAGGLVVVALATGGVVGLVGLGGSDNEPSTSPDNVGQPATTSAAPRSPATTPATTVADTPATSSDGAGAGAALGPHLRLSAGDADSTAFPRSYEGADGLETNTVLRLTVDGFDEFDQARAHQCTTVTRTVCGNEIGVQFGADGSAQFQYLVVDNFAPAANERRCQATAAPCTIVIESLDGHRRAEIATVFHDQMPPPGRITVTPRQQVAEGHSVLVEVDGYPAGTQVQAMLCAAPAATGTERCGAPGPTAAITVGPDGRGNTRLVIRSGLVGQDGVLCGPETTCGVSVASETVFARAPVVPVTFAAPPGTGYDPTRLVIGLAAALAMLALATRLVRHTDWSPIGQTAAPDIDNADYADLDAIIAAMPPENDFEDASHGTRRE